MQGHGITNGPRWVREREREGGREGEMDWTLIERLLEKWEGDIQLLNSVKAFVLYDHKINEEIRTDYTEFKWKWTQFIEKER